MTPRIERQYRCRTYVRETRAHPRGGGEMQGAIGPGQPLEELHRPDRVFVPGAVARERFEIQIADEQAAAALDDRRRVDERRPPALPLSLRQLRKRFVECGRQ